MFTLFTLAIGTALARGIKVPCGCAVVLADHVISLRTVMRNLALMGILVWMAGAIP
jgi:hypothetical protein